MGSCVSSNRLPENMFYVTSISDDKGLGDKGMMQVTEAELIYTDRRTAASWRWPLKFLRKYGCDGEVFSFEAGRKCPGGEGLYAFSAKRASQIFDMVARNINQGGLQPLAGELSPFPSESRPLDQNVLVSRRSSSQSPTHHTDQPNYANVDPMGNPLVLENGMDPTLPPPRPVAYKEVVFERPPEHHPVPKGDEARPSYTKIDFVETEQYNREKRLGTLAEMPCIPQGRTSTSSVSGYPSSSYERSSKQRSRMHTYSGPGGSGRSPSETSFSSQGSLTDSTRDIRPSLSSPLSTAAGASHVSLETPTSATALYQNVLVSAAGAGPGAAAVPLPQAPQQQYQNVTVGAGSVSQVFSTPQPMTNGGSHSSLHSSRSASQSGAVRSTRSKTSNGTSPVVVNGDPMAHYADLELGSNSTRKRATSTPTGGNLSYSVMEFSKDKKITSNHSCVPQPTLGESPQVNGDVRGLMNLSRISSKPEEPQESKVHIANDATAANGVTKTVADETKVEYGVLNFPVMAMMENTKSEHLKTEERQYRLDHGTSKKKNK